MSPNKHRLSPKSGLAVLFYLIIPLCSILLILQLYPELPPERFYARLYWIIPTAIVIVIFAQCGSLYQKGETKRFLSNIGFTIATIFWMFGLLGGGIVITTQWNDYEFSLHMTRYVLLIACVAALNVSYYTLEWRIYRKERPSFAHHEKKTATISVE
jgi:hypothetical protein